MGKAVKTITVVAKSTPRKWVQNELNQMAKNPLNAEPNQSATASSVPKKCVSTSNDTTSTTKNIESNSVEPTSPKTTNKNDRHQASPPNIVILLTPKFKCGSQKFEPGSKEI